MYSREVRPKAGLLDRGSCNEVKVQLTGCRYFGITEVAIVITVESVRRVVNQQGLLMLLNFSCLNS